MTAMEIGDAEAAYKTQRSRKMKYITECQAFELGDVAKTTVQFGSPAANYPSRLGKSQMVFNKMLFKEHIAVSMNDILADSRTQRLVEQRTLAEALMFLTDKVYPRPFEPPLPIFSYNPFNIKV
jgi:hypothetical protein